MACLPEGGISFTEYAEKTGFQTGNLILVNDGSDSSA